MACPQPGDMAATREPRKCNVSSAIEAEPIPASREMRAANRPHSIKMYRARYHWRSEAPAVSREGIDNWL